MNAQEEIRRAKRLLHEAEFGEMQERVNARQQFVPTVKALLGALEDSAAMQLLEKNQELEAELASYRRKEVAECLPAAPLPRRQERLQFGAHDGKLAACGPDG